MVDRGCSSRAENKRFTKSAKSRKSSSASSEFDEDFRERLEGRYLGNGLEIRPPSGTHHQVCCKVTNIFVHIFLELLNY